MDRNNTYTGWSKAFLIFAKYQTGPADISAEHDVLYAGPDPATVSEEDKAELERYGWHPQTSFDCFYHNT